MASPTLGMRPSAVGRVLFVDDEPTLRTLGEVILTHAGYEVRTAENGLSALHQIKQLMPDIVISDLRMPKMSGFELLSILRRRFPHMPLIAISGEFVTHSEMLGIADAFFAKGTYSAEQLCAKVGELLRETPHDNHQPDTPTMWVPVGPRGEIVLTCTDCLRSFPVLACPPQMGNLARETECVVCGTRLRYCIDDTQLSGDRKYSCSGLQQFVEIADTKQRDRNLKNKKKAA